MNDDILMFQVSAYLYIYYRDSTLARSSQWQLLEEVSVGTGFSGILQMYEIHLYLTCIADTKILISSSV